MPEGSLYIPDRSYDELRDIAGRFLAEHHTEGTIPVPVEEIMEFRLGLNIIAMPGLLRFFDIDGYVSKSLRDISVDQYIQETRDAPRPPPLHAGARTRPLAIGMMERQSGNSVPCPGLVDLLVFAC